MEIIGFHDYHSVGSSAAGQLGSSTAQRRSLARTLEAGATFVNALVASEPWLPFGGIKESGYGREPGVFGITEFVTVKTVYVK